MKKIYFTENINDETLANITDKMLRFEKKQESFKKRAILFKIIPAVAMVALVIGLINILPIFMGANIDVGPGNGNAGTEGVNISVSNDELTFLPAIMEKSFFEEKVLGVIPPKKNEYNNTYDNAAYARMEAYYILLEDAGYILDYPVLTDLQKELYIKLYEQTPVYIFDPYASEREINHILDIYREYTDLTDADIVQMAEDYDIPLESLRAVQYEPIYIDNPNYVVAFDYSSEILSFLPAIVEKTFFEEKVLGVIPETKIPEYGKYDKKKYVNVAYVRMVAYYTLKDANDPILTDEEKAELLEAYPICADYAIYVFDIFASEREINMMLDIYRQYTDLTDADIVQMAIDYDIPLESLCAVPGSIEDEEPSVYVEEPTDAQQFSGPSGIFEAPDYGMHIVSDDTAYLVFKNQSLQAALMEYFGLEWDGHITPDMLAQINSIEVNIRDEYSYIYDNKGLEEFDINGQYIEYTINGRTLDILPEFAAGGGLVEIMLERESIDILQYFDRIDYGIADEGYEIYYYVQKADLSIEDKLFVYDALARNAANRISVYTDEDGNYLTVAEIPIMFGLSFVARYYDKAEYDATDIAYMPNLTEFNVNGISVKE